LALLLLLPLSTFAGELRAGDTAPSFTLPAFDGRQVSLADLRGRVVCLDFWASWCATCRTALPALDALARRTPSAAFVAIDVDMSRADADRFLAEHIPEPALTVLHDPEGAVLARYRAGGLPTLYLIDRDGVVRLAESGYSPDDVARIARALDALVGPAPTPVPDLVPTSGAAP
jgi:thiol-disulfide isomerase/thioredoxin